MNLICVLCSSEEFNKTYALFPSHSIYSMKNIVPCGKDNLTQEIEGTKLVVLDIDLMGEECYSYLDEIHKIDDNIRVIIAGDLKNIVFPDNIPRVFHFLNKPFLHENFTSVIQKSFTLTYDEEKRREPRIPIELPVELFFKDRFVQAETRNLSLHGMQAALPEDNQVQEIMQMYRNGSSPIPACKLYMEYPENEYSRAEHLNISCALRYVCSPGEEKDQNLLGFEFRDLDLDLRTQLQNIVIW